MASVTVTVDCADPGLLASFWAALLGYDQHGAAGQYASITAGENGVAGPKLIFQTVPEGKHGKNRVHLDIDLDDGVDLEPEVARAIELGATVLGDDVVEEFGLRWRVLADPEGNEFCIVAKASP